MQRRLRRMFIEAWRKDQKEQDFVRFTTKFLCDKDHFYKFVGNYGHFHFLLREMGLRFVSAKGGIGPSKKFTDI